MLTCRPQGHPIHKWYKRQEWWGRVRKKNQKMAVRFELYIGNFGRCFLAWSILQMQEFLGAPRFINRMQNKKIFFITFSPRNSHTTKYFSQKQPYEMVIKGTSKTENQINWKSEKLKRGENKKWRNWKSEKLKSGATEKRRNWNLVKELDSIAQF